MTIAATAIPDEPPIMCTLAGGDFHARVAWIAALNANALQAQERDDLRLVLTYAPEARERVEEMVAGERECCAFLDFDVAVEPDAVRVTITAPERARAAADDAFAPFLPRAPSLSASTGCGCGAA